MRRQDNNVILSAQSLGKLYKLYDSPRDRLKDMLLSGFGRSCGREFWALRDINFEVGKGQTFGIIRRNGSGKSTLLQMIAGILKPSEGTMEVKGKVAALLELGSGFNPEFTGRENVYLNGAILGMSKEYMKERFEEIVDFAEIGEYIDQPVKFYSSGMFVRLAFAVATSVEAELLLIDEALAVGDVFFRQKCYKRLDELKKKGVAVILVSHSMNEVQEFCQQALLLNKGCQVSWGDTLEAVNRYFLMSQEDYPTISQLDECDNSNDGYTNMAFTNNNTEDDAQEVIEWPYQQNNLMKNSNATVISSGQAVCTEIFLCDKCGISKNVFYQGEVLNVLYEFEVQEDISTPVGGVVIRNEKNIVVHGKNTMQYIMDFPERVNKGGKVRFAQEFKLDIGPGEYSIELGFSSAHTRLLNLKQLRYEEYERNAIEICRLSNVASFVVSRNIHAPRDLPFHGVCDLSGRCWINVHK